MALKAFVETLDDIPEELREHYTEKDGAYYLALDDFGKHPGAVTLKRTLDRVNRDKDGAAAKAAELEERLSAIPSDFDPDEWGQLKAGRGGGDEAAIAALKEQHAKAVQNLQAKHAADFDGLQKQLNERDAYIDGTLIDGGLKDALIGAGVIPDLMDGALASLRGAVKVHHGSDGTRAAIVETELGDVSVADYVRDWAGSKGKAYISKPIGPGGTGSQRPGSGAPSGDIGGDTSARRAALASKFPDLAIR